MKAMKNMMMAAALVVFAASVTTVSAQGPLHKRVEFTISSPFEMNNSNVVLPAGSYILYQVHQNDLNLFALYKDNLQRSPIAMVRTTRISYLSGDTPDDSEMLVNLDSENTTTLPVVAGWTIPGEDGWEIISVVPDRDRIAGYTVSRAYRHNGRVHVVAKMSGF